MSVTNKRKLGEGSTPLRPAVPNPLYEESRMEDTIADTPDVRQRIAIQPIQERGGEW
jgi:hypothetical protein